MNLWRTITGELRLDNSATKDLLNYLDDEVIIRSSSVLVDEEEMNLVNHAKPVHLAIQVIIDSSCSHHVVGENFSKYFTSRTNIKPVKLRLPDGKTYTSNEKVSMTLRVKSTQGTKTLKLSDVILVPSLNQCLMSVCQFCTDRYLISFWAIDVTFPPQIGNPLILCDFQLILFIAWQ